MCLLITAGESFLCSSVCINYILLYHKIMCKFFNYSYNGTLSALRLRYHVPLQKRSQWMLMDGGSQSRHAAQPFWNVHTSSGILTRCRITLDAYGAKLFRNAQDATTCGRIFIFPQLACSCDCGKTNS